MLIESLDFSKLYALSSEDDWDRAAQILTDSARRLEQAGAEALIIGANSMHRVYDQVAEGIDIPIFHIAECVGEQMAADGAPRASLIGTSNVMTGNFYRRRLVNHGIDLLPPDMDNAAQLDQIIYEELMIGRATRQSERILKTLITRKQQEGAQAIVLASTELGMVVDLDANVLPIYDSTRIHAEYAANWILST